MTVWLLCIGQSIHFRMITQLLRKLLCDELSLFRMMRIVVLERFLPHANMFYIYRADLRGMEGAAPLLLRTRPHPLTNQRVPHLLLFYDINFRLTNPKNYLRAPSAPIYTIFERERALKKKRDYLVNIFQKVPKIFQKMLRNFQKVPKNFFSDIFFQISLWRKKSSENQFGQPNKKVRQNFQHFSANPLPPRSAPVCTY